jgi:ribose/xylose/arabinose/galactoside ABC-type transport system permease subunit
LGDLPGPEVVVCYALSGLAAGVAGALTTARAAFFAPHGTTGILLPVLAALAVAGSARGSGLVAPLAAAAGAVVVGVMRFALISVDRLNVDVILAGLLVGTLVVGHAIHRLMRPRPARRT